MIARVIATTTPRCLMRFVREAVSEQGQPARDRRTSGYRHLERTFPARRRRARHRQYVVGAVHTQTIEGFWSLLKRGIVGTFHKVSRKYLPLYVAEFEFRYNNRNNPDIFGAAVEGAEAQSPPQKTEAPSVELTQK